jgi:hypothetical protein
MISWDMFRFVIVSSTVHVNRTFTVHHWMKTSKSEVLTIFWWSFMRAFHVNLRIQRIGIFVPFEHNHNRPLFHEGSHERFLSLDFTSNISLTTYSYSHLVIAGSATANSGLRGFFCNSRSPLNCAWPISFWRTERRISACQGLVWDLEARKCMSKRTVRSGQTVSNWVVVKRSSVELYSPVRRLSRVHLFCRLWS